MNHDACMVVSCDLQSQQENVAIFLFQLATTWNFLLLN
jgi:hypothetical protein